MVQIGASDSGGVIFVVIRFMSEGLDFFGLEVVVINLCEFGTPPQTERMGFDSRHLMSNSASPLQLQLALCSSCKKGRS